MAGTIYVVEYQGTNVAKIGFTTQLDIRLRQLRSWAGRPDGALPELVVITTYEGDQELEKALHHHFRNRVILGSEGFDARWVRASLPLDLAALRRAYAASSWDEVTEIMPRGFRTIPPSPIELEKMLEFDDRWFTEVNTLRYPAGITRFRQMLKRPLTDLEITRFLRVLEHRDRAFVWVILGTGLRIAEAVTLLNRSLRSSLVTLSTRHLYISAQARQELESYIRTLEFQAPDAPLFPSRKGDGAIGVNAAQDRIALLMKEQAIHADPASLRTTHMVGLWSQGTDPQVIARQLGYDSVARVRSAMAEVLI